MKVDEAKLLNRYNRLLFGKNHQGFYSRNLEYTSHANYGDFVSFVSQESEIGIFDADTNNLITSALTPGQRFFIAQLQDGEVRKSTILTYDETQMEIYKTPYKEAKKLKKAIGWNGSSGS